MLKAGGWKSIALVVSIFLGLRVNLAAQRPSPSPGKQLCLVEGQVVKASSGDPVKGAKVRLNSRQDNKNAHSYTAFTDASGRFSLKGVAPDRYYFHASHNGYVEQPYRPEGSGPDGALLELSPGQQEKKILFRMMPAAAIFGRITDEDGEPVEGVTVKALRQEPTDQDDPDDDEPAGFAKPELNEVGTAQTNDLGEYRIYGLPRNDYYILAMMGGLADGKPIVAGNSGDQGTLVPTFYPGVVQPGQAQKIRLAVGQEVRVDLSLKPAKAGSLSGRVIGANGKPARASVVLLPVARATFEGADQTVITDVQGKFSFHTVFPGSYILQASVFGLEQRASAERNIEMGPDDIANLELRVSRGAEIHGSVSWRGSCGKDPTGFVIISSAEKNSIQYGYGEVKSDGSFKTSEFAPGLYRLTVQGIPDGCYLQSATFGTEDVFQHGIKLGDGAAPSLNINVAPGAAQVSGVVMNEEKPIPGARVRIKPDPPNRFRKDRSSATITDQHGRFALKNLSPGSYKVIAIRPEDPSAPAQDEAADPPPEKAEATVSVTENDNKAVELKFSKGAQ